MAVWLLALLSAAAAEPSLRSNRTFGAMSKEAPVHLAWTHMPNFCLSADANQLENGVKVHLWECDNTWQSKGQNFVVDAENRFRMHANTDYCLVVDGDHFVNGAKIQLWKCNEKNPNQRWYSQMTGQISSSSEPSMCLVIDGNNAFNGAKIQMWSCEGNSQLKEWMRLVLGPGAKVFGVPNEDGACEAPFEALDSSLKACVDAAEAMRPGSGCYSSQWESVVTTDYQPTWPRGCYFYAACQGGCGLYFNPSGQGKSCPSQGDCMSISVICQLQQ
ncbi:unnamed protein product [Durusdinium trenchii]|uniref:Extracellular exo-alpha-L-arabinofuranosidase (ABF) (Arabinosidase) (Arabinoxylan arabinofuranohydrolase) n=2 Tax=Durusdinium trenchii TaxID=1381693 RepID=A0ABP0JKH0_9DINO